MDIFSAKTLTSKTCLKLGLISVLFLLLFSPTYEALYRDWMFDDNHSHGIFVPFISLFLVWRNRKRIPWKKAQPSIIGLVILISSLIVYLVGYAGGIFVLPRLAMVATLIGLLIYNLGKEVFKPLLFPIAFLVFMIPIPHSVLELVSLPLQTLATVIAEQVIKDVFSLPVLREGNMLFFATTSLEVAEACSGIRSLMTFLMLGSLFAHMYQGPNRSKAIIFAMAIPLAVFTNLLRVIGTGVLAHFFGESIAKGFFHSFSGFAFFAVGFVLMVAIRRLIELIDSKREIRKALVRQA